MNAVAVRDLSVALGRREVLSGVGLSLRRGALLGLIGPNGAGKTTLLRAVAGLIPSSGGVIEVLGRPLDSLDLRTRARRVAYLAQGHESHWDLTVESLVGLGRLPHLSPWAGPASRDRAAVAAALEAADVAHLVARPVNEISGGERARVMLARALAGEPEVMLADEPVSGLDPAHQLDVMHLLKGLAARGAAVIVVLHDLTLAARFCDRLALLHRGMLWAEGPPDEVLTPRALATCYGVAAHRGVANGARFVVPIRRLHLHEGS